MLIFCFLYDYRILIISLASAGIVLSFFASNTCQFLYFGSDAFYEIDPSFDDQTEGWIGVFKYDVITNENRGNTSERCSLYDNFLNMNVPNEALLASQLCAVIAPSLALIAIVISAFELLCCKFFGSFIAASVLFLIASLFQSGTFGLFLIEPSLCFDSDGCEIGKAAYFSASAVVAFFTSCIILCCSPRPSSCLQNHHQKKCDDLPSIAPTNLSPRMLIYDEVEAP